MNKTYRPRVSIDMDEEDVRFLSNILPYGQRMAILRTVIKDFISELQRNPATLELLLLRELPSTLKIPVRKELLIELEKYFGADKHGHPSTPIAARLLDELRRLL